MATAGPARSVLLGHVHNASVAAHSAGAALAPAALASLFPGSTLFDDADLTRAGAFGASLSPRQPRELASAEAVSLAWRRTPRPTPPGQDFGFLGFDEERPLTRNPLYVDGRLKWPSERYRDEYAALATYPAVSAGPLSVPLTDETLAAARRREYVQLPDRW